MCEEAVCISRRKVLNMIEDFAIFEKETHGSKLGVLICEGSESSIDKDIYQAVFPDLYVIPVGGCSNVTSFVIPARKILSFYGMYAFGIADRDSISKIEERNQYKKHRVYTTKLPFIENIICTPEVLRIVCEYLKINPDEFINTIEEELLKTLFKRFVDTLPVNLSFGKNEKMIGICFSGFTDKKTISKCVMKGSILYSFRDKVITAIIGSHLGVTGRKGYYSLIQEMLADKFYRVHLAKAFSKFIPKFEFYDFEDYM